MTIAETDQVESIPAGVLLSLTRQQCNLLLMRPLFEIALRIRQEEARRLFDGLDTNYLCLLLIDFLAEGGTLGRGRTHPEVLAYMSDVVQRLKPELADADARKVGGEILGSLLNTDNRQESFRYQYFDATKQRMLRYTFALLRYERGDDNGYYYRVTDHGFQVYLGMLNLGAGEMQEFMEMMLAKLIARGRIDEALDVSRQARVEAARYFESIRSHLNNASRVPDQVTWHDDLAPFLESSRTHIDGRREQERQILNNVTERLQDAGDVSTREKFYRLKQMVDSEYDIHTQLMTLIGNAGARFMRSQVALFRARSRQRLPNLDDRVLPDLVKLPVEGLAALADTEDFCLFSAVAPRFLYLPQLFDLLLEPLPDELVPDESAADMVDIVALLPQFSPEVISAAEKFLRESFATNAKTDIEKILANAEAAGLGRPVQEYMTFIMYQCFSRKESPFDVDVAAKGRFRSRVVEGSRLEFTLRLNTHEPK
jgi:hypothetical protein